MVSSIGLGGFLANLFFLIFFILFVSIVLTLLKKKKHLLSILVTSVSLNIASFLFFSGNATSIEYFNVVFWPIANIVLIIFYVYKKKKQ
ncbi:MAG: hypothetical protein KAQ63_02650 [Candidatus Moranbacteria bacterium]|nr:hypothetical protein [Candidatus Moranbacteria bacterium]